MADAGALAQRYIRILLMRPRPPPPSGQDATDGGYAYEGPGNEEAGAGETTRKRARSAGVGAEGGGGAVLGNAGVRMEKKGPSAPASRAHPESAAACSVDVTVEDADVLDCGVCFLPLKPPIFQCGVGHVVCSPCCDKVRATGKCHVCRVATRSYRRCHDMERLVGSIHVTCPYATHGCAERPPYHDRESHRLACAHAPCHCPSEACGFLGSTEALLDHFSAAHSWPCIMDAYADDNGYYAVCLHEGFNFLRANADCHTGDEKQGAIGSFQCLLLLTVARQLHAHVISVHCIDPHAAAASCGQGPNSKEMECDLSYSVYGITNSLSGRNKLTSHYQRSTFRVACTDLSNGLPKPDDCFQFVVPNSVIGDHNKDGIKVHVRVFK